MFIITYVSLLVHGATHILDKHCTFKSLLLKLAKDLAMGIFFLRLTPSSK